VQATGSPGCWLVNRFQGNHWDVTSVLIDAKSTLNSVKMTRSLSLLLIGLLFAATTAAISAQTCPYQGIYEGKELIRVDGQAPAYFPTRLTVLPDGHSIIGTSEITGRLGRKFISTGVIRGSFEGNVFTGSTRERFNLSVHQYSGTIRIRFIGNQARVNYSSNYIPPGYIHDPREEQERIFYRIRS
jgi:hypothetical protein